MIRKKWLIISVVLFGIIGIILLLLFTLFSLKNVEIDFRTSTFNLTASEEEIIKSGDFAYGGSVVFHSKKGYVEKLEATFPYIKVINIETVFPNKFVVHVSERQEVYAISVKDGFAILDQEFKVLKKVEIFTSKKTNAILLNGLNLQNVEVGQFLEIEYVDIYSSFIENNRLLNEQCALIKSMQFEEKFNEITKRNETNVILSLFGGQNVVILNCRQNLTLKVTSVLQVYSQLYSLIGKEIKLINESGEIEILGIWDKESLDSAIIEIGNYYSNQGIYFKVLPNTQK